MDGQVETPQAVAVEADRIDASVIVACYNAAETLGETLDSLAAQAWGRPWEIVFADNGSTDESRAMFADRARRYPGVAMRLVDASARRGKSHALNAAIRAARGRTLLFCDADDTVAPGWLAAMGAALDRHPLVAARIDIERLNQEWARAERPHPQTTGLSELPHAPHCTHAGGATLGFRREVFEAVGEFDPDFAVLEDTDYCVRAFLAGYRIVYAPDAVYHYRYRDDPDAIFRQARSYARYRAKLRSRYAPESPLAAPGRWLRLVADVTRLSLVRAGNAALGRRQDPLTRGRVSRKLGHAVGDLSGALAFRVAPPARAPGRASLGRRALDQALRPAAPTLVGVRTSEKLIALTFDDGPDPASTPELLDMLARHGMKATFFMVGSRAARHPGLVARVAAEGHAIGNHTWDHPALSTLGSAEVLDQLRRAGAALAPHGSPLMRPPYGAQNLRTHLLARRLGFRVVTWNVNGADWRADDAATLAERVLAAAGPGAIVLLHDSLFSFEEERFRDRGPTIAAVGMLAERLPDFRFVTVPELLRHGPPIERLWVSAPPADYLAALQEAPTP